MASLLDKVTALIAEPAKALGYNLVLVKFNETSRNRTLQIMAERITDGGMAIEDCEKLSRTVSALLDVDDVISSAYRLEVSSPGIDRPLTRLHDFADYKGFTAKIETQLPIEGRKRFSGTLLGLEGEMVAIKVDHDEYHIAFNNIANAKLVLTDELIKAHQKRYAS